MRWWRAKSQKHAEQAVEATSSSSSAEDNGDNMSEESRNNSSSSSGYTSPADLEDYTIVQDYIESPSVAETEYSESSESSAESSDSICQSFYKVWMCSYLN